MALNSLVLFDGNCTSYLETRSPTPAGEITISLLGFNDFIAFLTLRGNKLRVGFNDFIAFSTLREKISFALQMETSTAATR